MTDITKAAEAIVEARKARRQMTMLPNELTPQSMAEAYAIQDASMSLYGQVGAWKTTTGADLRCSPIPASVVQWNPARLPLDPRYKLEVEVGVRLSKDLTERQTIDSIRSAIGSLHPAIEVAMSRFSTPPSQLVAMADCQSNEAVIVGAAVAGWSASELLDVRMELSIDGETVATASKGPSTLETLEALTWLANQAIERGTPLLKDQIIITGARIKTPGPDRKGAVIVRVEDDEAVVLELA